MNADNLQQTITDVGKQDPALQATGRTATNSHGQSMPYPPFGMPRIFFESHPNSSEATSGLGLFCLWGNTSLTATVTGTRSLTTRAPHALHLFPISHSSIQAIDHNLLYTGRDALYHLSIVMELFRWPSNSWQPSVNKRIPALWHRW